MPGAGKLDRRVVIERAVTVRNEFGEAEPAGWSTYAERWAERKDVSDGERAAAGQVGAFLQSRFVVRSDSVTRTCTPKDRLQHDGGTWSIFGIKETTEGRFRFLEITASREID